MEPEIMLFLIYYTMFFNCHVLLFKQALNINREQGLILEFTSWRWRRGAGCDRKEGPKKVNIIIYMHNNQNTTLFENNIYIFLLMLGNLSISLSTRTVVE